MVVEAAEPVRDVEVQVAAALPFALAVAASRIVLGLHYPSDVVLGALMGAVSAVLVLLVN